MKKLLLIMCALLFMTSCVFAAQPTHASMKIFLNPFYVGAMNQSVNTTYNFSTITPDGMSEIKSAIITVDAWISPTRTFNGWVNGVRCNTRDYTVSTSFAGAGRAVITLDCSNAIKPMTTNIFNFTVSGGNIGSSTAWVDITYVNNPMGSMVVSGTEYQPGDQTTTFLQLVDSNYQPVNNASCYLSMWNPANASGIHALTINSSPMLVAPGSQGMYYYDQVAPSTLGVYMMSARCAYPYAYIWIYPETETVFYPTEQINTGTFQGGGNPQVLNSRQDMLYERCDATLALSCSSNYTFNLSTYGTITNISNISLFFSGQSNAAGANLIIAYWNGTAFVNLPNQLAWSGTGSTVPGAYDEFLTNSIPTTGVINNTVKVRLTTSALTVRLFYNWLSIAVLSNTGQIQELKGASEMHVTNISQMAAVWVWNATNRTLTQNITGTNFTINTTTVNYTNNITFNTTNTTYLNNFTNNITFNTTNVTYVNNFTNNLTINTTTVNTTTIASDVWNFSTRNLTFYNMTDTTNYTAISGLINTSQAAILTNTTGYFTSILGNFSLISDNVWNYVGRYVHGILN